MLNTEYRYVEDFLKDPTFIIWANQGVSEAEIDWGKYLQDHPEKQATIEKAAMIARGIAFNPRYVSAEKVRGEWQKHQEIREKRNKTRYRQLGKTWWRVAAAIALLVMSFGGYKVYMAGETTFQTAYGERMEITLPDGTEVDLNANSRLSFIRSNPRKVRLDGEAYFTVKKKPETGERFFVETTDLDVEVLGTIFNVNSRNQQTEVVLEEGKVRLDLDDQDLIMERGGLELVTYSIEKKMIIKRETEVKAELHTSWKDGVLEFENTPLLVALKILEETYGVEVVIENPSDSDQILNGGVPNDNLQVFIETLKTIYGLNMELEGDRLIIR